MSKLTIQVSGKRVPGIGTARGHVGPKQSDEVGTITATVQKDETGRLDNSPKVI